MGLDTSHGCWHGAYSGFHRWRMKLCEVAGYGNLEEYEGFGGIGSTPPGDKEWPNLDSDPLLILLVHSDCDGEILWEECKPIADRLTELLPALTRAGDGKGHIGLYVEKTQTFIDGLMRAHKAKENVDFH